MTPLVIDLSHHNFDGNRRLDFAKAKAAGIVGVIYKATEGATYQDPYLAKARTAVRAAGLRWGVYHFATAASSSAQAKNFLDTAAPDADTLVALDFEHNDPHPSNTTTPAIARDLLKRFADRIGRRPVLYTGSFMFDCFGSRKQADLGEHRLWWAAYRTTPNIHPSWPDYWLWQYSDGVHGPGQKTVDGIGDCDYYDGAAAKLLTEWAT